MNVNASAVSAAEAQSGIVVNPSAQGSNGNQSPDTPVSAQPMDLSEPEGSGRQDQQQAAAGPEGSQTDGSPSGLEEGKEGKFNSGRERVGRTLRPFYLHQWLDVLDTDKNWLEGQVIGVNPEARTIRVHYKGWVSRYDEDLPMDSDRVALLHTHTRPAFHPAPHVDLSVGAEVDVLDTTDKWCRALVIMRDEEHQMVRVRYFGWDPKYDEWINMESYRMAPQHTWVARPELAPPVLRRARSNYRLGDDMETRFREMLLRTYGWQIVRMREDGSCLFRAVAHQVYGDPELHGIVREKCMKYITSERYFFSQFISEQFERYVDRMRQEGEWGDNVEIQAMSEIYNRPILIYAYSTTPMKTYQGPNNIERPIRLSYHMRSHYNSILDPANHSAWISKARPGEMEEKHIALSRRGGGAGLNRHARVSADDDAELRLALEASRKQLFKGDMTDLELAIMESIKTATGDAALASSSSDPLQVALQASLLEAAAAAAAGPARHHEQKLAPSIDSDLDAAIAASLGDLDAKLAGPAADQTPSSPVSGVDRGRAEGKRNEGAGPPSSASKREAVIARVTELGLDRSSIEAAWGKVNAGPIEAIPEETLIANLVAYLLR